MLQVNMMVADALAPRCQAISNHHDEQKIESVSQYVYHVTMLNSLAPGRI